MTKRTRERIIKQNRGIIVRIAQRAGVSLGTASRVFHGKITCSPAVRAIIEDELAKIRQQEQSV